MIVKVCGITRVADAEACAELGVDWIGLNFVEGSPRRIDEEIAKRIVAATRGRVKIVGVFADRGALEIEGVMRRVGLEVAQLHGAESPELVASLGERAYKAVRIASDRDLADVARYAGLVLVDAKVEGKLGGTGASIDRDLAARAARTKDVLLAGGLAPENVAAAIAAVRPFGVDAASGVEASPGVKDRAKIAAFVAAARGG